MKSTEQFNGIGGLEAIEEEISNASHKRSGFGGYFREKRHLAPGVRDALNLLAKQIRPLAGTLYKRATRVFALVSWLVAARSAFAPRLLFDALVLLPDQALDAIEHQHRIFTEGSDSMREIVYRRPPNVGHAVRGDFNPEPSNGAEWAELRQHQAENHAGFLQWQEAQRELELPLARFLENPESARRLITIASKVIARAVDRGVPSDFVWRFSLGTDQEGEYQLTVRHSASAETDAETWADMDPDVLAMIVSGQRWETRRPPHEISPVAASAGGFA